MDSVSSRKNVFACQENPVTSHESADCAFPIKEDVLVAFSSNVLHTQVGI